MHIFVASAAEHGHAACNRCEQRFETSRTGRKMSPSTFPRGGGRIAQQDSILPWGTARGDRRGGSPGGGLSMADRRRAVTPHLAALCVPRRYIGGISGPRSGATRPGAEAAERLTSDRAYAHSPGDVRGRPDLALIAGSSNEGDPRADRAMNDMIASRIIVGLSRAAAGSIG